MGGWIDGQITLGEYEERVRSRLARYEAMRVIARLWAQDASLWSEEPAVQQSIRQRLGWLPSPLVMRARLDELDCVRQMPHSEAVLLGMGGSSLAPEVFQRAFGNAPSAPRLRVLDNTTAAAVQALRDDLDPLTTLFILSSKSGTTIETQSFGDYFYGQAARQGKNFIAITDPGSRLIRESVEREYSALFLNPQDIGGRYSVFSFFGLVPAAIIGVDVEKLLERAIAELQATTAAVPAEQNAALALGVILGELAAAGRDKLTFLASPTLEAFGDWAEQLVAESMGKSGRGVLPVVGERPGNPDQYGADRLFVYLRLEGEGVHDQRADALRAAGHPVIEMALLDVYDLGAQFFRWEVATAVAGMVLGINPFDEPNVTESKTNTMRLLRDHEAGRELPGPAPDVQGEGIQLSGVAGESPEAALRTFADDTPAESYIAILAYLPMSAENEAALRDLQAALRDRSGAATTLGFGPRFLHSTGQFHKGGPPSGRFIQIVADDEPTVAIPGATYDFNTLAHAQSLGDLEALRSRSYPTLRLHLSGDVPAHLARLTAALEG